VCVYKIKLFTKVKQSFLPQGIIAPKIEISTKTVIEEILGFYDTSMNKCYVINPKMINSKVLHRYRLKSNKLVSFKSPFILLRIAKL